MKCDCCRQPNIEKGKSSPPYLCQHCGYITDDEGDHYCKECDIWMDESPAWYHSFRSGSHTVVSR